MSEGFFLMHRGWRDNPIFRDEFSRADAWVWLIENACWKPTRFDVSGKTITLDRGQICASVRYLADAWKWSKSTVERFLTRLQTETMIVVETGQGKNVITICNYRKYQDLSERERDTNGTASGTVAGQQRDTKEQGNKGTIVEEEPNGSPSTARATRSNDFPMPEWADPDVWSDFLKNRKAKRLPSTATAHRKFLKDIEALADPQWPPGRLLEEIVARGWGAAYDPRPKDYQNGNQHQTAGRTPAGHRGSPRRDDFSREIDEQGGFAGPFDPSGPSGRWGG